MRSATRIYFESVVAIAFSLAIGFGFFARRPWDFIVVMLGTILLACVLVLQFQRRTPKP